MSSRNHYEDGAGAQEYWERESSSDPDLEAESLFKAMSDFPTDEPSNSNPKPNSRPSSPSQSLSQSLFPPQYMAYSPLSQLHQQPPCDANSSKLQLQHFPPIFLPLEDTDMCEGNEESGSVETRSKQPFRRPRSAETHNLAERNRRSRLKDKIRALKETLPDCDKSDADSILTHAINYVESSKLKLQWMSDALKQSGGGGAQQCSAAPHAWITGASPYNPSFRNSMSGEMPRPVLPLPPPVCYTTASHTLPHPHASAQDGTDDTDTTTPVDQGDMKTD